MTASRPDQPRTTILLRSAEWHAVSALRSSSPLKDRDALKRLVATIDLASLAGLAEEIRHATLSAVSGSSGADAPAAQSFEHAYDEWLGEQVDRIIAAAPELSFGWAAKLVNVYIKTLVYISPDFWPELRPYIHPAIDGMLQDALESAGLQKGKVGLKDMAWPEYMKLVAGYRTVARAENMLLVEIDKYWEY